MYEDLKGKTALVTGAGKRTGIGFAIAEKMASCGANVIIADLGKGPESVGGVKMGMRQEMESIASIHALFNNAGASLGAPSPAHTYNEEAWMKTIDVNLHGVFRVSRAVLPMMIERHQGAIINISSKAGKTPPLANGAYAVAKAGVIMLTKVMALELARQGIRVNALCPGIVMTDLQVYRFEMEAKYLNQTRAERERAWANDIPQARIGSPGDVADLAAYLASKESSYITGQAINVDGGLLMAI
ncbi:MAG: SDR family oxidoreductase [Proteobacteria bacterium]|nr:SDR family oxidoreductase [Pseudomonadota bacterium]